MVGATHEYLQFRYLMTLPLLEAYAVDQLLILVGFGCASLTKQTLQCSEVLAVRGRSGKCQTRPSEEADAGTSAIYWLFPWKGDTDISRTRNF